MFSFEKRLRSTNIQPVEDGVPHREPQKSRWISEAPYRRPPPPINQKTMNYKYKSRRRRRNENLPFVLTGLLAAAAIVSLAVLLISKTALPHTESPEEPIAPPPKAELTDVRGVFVPTVYNLSFPSKADISETELKSELNEIVKTAKEAGLNTVFFQVRPSCDALYSSKYFPVSTVLSTTGELPLDCLEYLSDLCKKEGISLHAWINPLRVTAYDREISELPENSPAKKLEKSVVSYGGKLYFDPGDPEARELICNGIREICENYDVDGIVFDDYFYPYPEYETNENGTDSVLVFNDNYTYKTYGTDYENIGSFRRDNVNKLVKAAYETVKSADADCLFGVSCFGIWKNSDGENGGSMTVGSQSYYETYCDTLAWVEGGYVDYLAPQIYWDCDSVAANYKILAEWWNEKLADTEVDLLIAHAAYRYDGSFDSKNKEMTKQLTIAKNLSNCKGSIFYSYNAIRDNLDGITKEISDYYTTKDTTPEE